MTGEGGVMTGVGYQDDRFGIFIEEMTIMNLPKIWKNKVVKHRSRRSEISAQKLWFRKVLTFGLNILIFLLVVGKS